jgi:hypothetical protein
VIFGTIAEISYNYDIECYVGASMNILKHLYKYVHMGYIYTGLQIYVYIYCYRELCWILCELYYRLVEGRLYGVCI